MEKNSKILLKKSEEDNQTATQRTLGKNLNNNCTKLVKQFACFGFQITVESILIIIIITIIYQADAAIVFFLQNTRLCYLRKR